LGFVRGWGEIFTVFVGRDVAVNSFSWLFFTVSKLDFLAFYPVKNSQLGRLGFSVFLKIGS